MGCTHEDAIHGARLNTKRTKHALGIVNRKSRNLKALRTFDAFFADVDAVHGTGFGTLITRDASR